MNIMFEVIIVGNFYLGDVGFMLKHNILTPYRGVRYHLKEYNRKGPQNPKELFNLWHTSLRNVIERALGVLKKQFPIICNGTKPYYSLETMNKILWACCILHNYLREMDNNEALVEEVDRKLMEKDKHPSRTQNCDEEYRLGSNFRDVIVNNMWLDYGNI